MTMKDFLFKDGEMMLLKSVINCGSFLLIIHISLNFTSFTIHYTLLPYFNITIYEKCIAEHL